VANTDRCGEHLAYERIVRGCNDDVGQLIGLRIAFAAVAGLRSDQESNFHAIHRSPIRYGIGRAVLVYERIVVRVDAEAQLHLLNAFDELLWSICADPSPERSRAWRSARGCSDIVRHGLDRNYFSVPTECVAHAARRISRSSRPAAAGRVCDSAAGEGAHLEVRLCFAAIEQGDIVRLQAGVRYVGDGEVVFWPAEVG